MVTLRIERGERRREGELVEESAEKKYFEICDI